MLRQLTSPQLTELEQFWQLEGGWGDYKEDYRNAQLLSMQANLNRNPKKRSQPYKLDDFVMRPKQQKVTSEDKQQKIRSAFDMMAGTISKRRK